MPTTVEGQDPVYTRPARPTFDNPPVIETVLGVEFLPLEHWDIPHFGLFWNEIREEFPYFEMQPPLLSQGSSTILAQSPPVRCLFLDSSRTLLVQLQRDRFVFNWRSFTGADPYPRHDALRPTFAKLWSRYCRFLNVERIGMPDVQQCEVSYVNLIERQDEQDSVTSLADVSPLLGDSLSNALTPAIPVTFQATYALPSDEGHLTVSLQPGLRPADGAPVLQLTLVARGRPASSSEHDILERIDSHHDWNLRSFVAFTSATMHKSWGRRDEL